MAIFCLGKWVHLNFIFNTHDIFQELYFSHEKNYKFQFSLIKNNQNYKGVMNIKIKVSVVLGSYNRCPFLKLAIKSIREELKKIPHEIIVIDGGSNDGALKWLLKQKDIITIVQHNHGKWKGQPIKRHSWGYYMNLGFKCAKGKYICMLSDDCLVVPGAVVNGYNLFEEKIKSGKKIGAVAFYYRNWPKDKKYFVNRTLSNVVNVNHGIYLQKALEEVNFLDEESFLFQCGDDDICLKLTHAGYKVIDSPNSFIEHLEHPSIRQNIRVGEKDLENLLVKWKNIFYFGEETIHTKTNKEYNDKYLTINKFKIPYYSAKIKYYLDTFIWIKKVLKILLNRILSPQFYKEIKKRVKKY